MADLTYETVLAYITRTCAETLGRSVRADQSFFEAGLDSLGMVRLAGGLSRLVGRRVSPIEMLDFPSPHDLAQHLVATPDADPEPGLVQR